MGRWAFCSGEPLTVEDRRRVYNVDNPDQEGYIRVRHAGGRPGTWGSVYNETPVFDRDGVVVEVRDYRVLDPNPTLGEVKFEPDFEAEQANEL